MARVDLMKKLFISYQERDDQAFIAAAEEIIVEERKKHHVSAANQLQAALKPSNNGRTSANRMQNMDPVPRDVERGVPLLEVKSVDRYLSDLVLNHQTRDAIAGLVKEYISWEVLETNGLSPVRHVLFCGPPGCGKTATAEAIASELGLPLLYVRFDAVVSSLLGETAGNLRRVFDYAARGQWVVLFDEFDAIGRSRDDSSEHGEIKRVVNSYLQMMDNFKSRSLVIASTNFEDALDPAIWRRFDDVVRFERPTLMQIGELVAMNLKSVKPSPSQIDDLKRSLQGSAHSDVERVCLDIRKDMALSGERRMTSGHIERATKRWNQRKRAMKGINQEGPKLIDRD